MLLNRIDELLESFYPSFSSHFRYLSTNQDTNNIKKDSPIAN